MEKENKIKIELESWESTLADISRKMPFSLPENYFQGLEERINFLKHSGEEDEVQLSRELPYTIPTGYFENFAGDLLSSIKEQEAVEHLPVTMPFELPSGYFEHLPAQITAVINSEALVDTFPKGNPFYLEEEYFEAFPQLLNNRINKETAKNKTTKTIPLGRQIWLPLRWTAAAAVVLMIGFGTLRNYIVPQSPEMLLSKLPKSAINSYVQQNIDEFNTESLIKNLPASGINLATATTTKNLKSEDIEKYLDNNTTDISESELE